MPVLVPSLSPPSPGLPKAQASSPAATIPSESVDQSKDTKSDDPETFSTVSRISLDLENISDRIASDLAFSLVGHVLFLKSQIPFPVLQLERIPGSKSSPRALKLRTDLLASFDTLSSHLGTTFSALSTAFALTSRSTTPGSAATSLPTRRAYLAILVGPSIGSAKTKILFAVDGLVAKVWGERDDLSDAESDTSDSSAEEESDEEDEDEEEGERSEPSEIDSSDAFASSPPPSRSPSPSNSTRSCSPDPPPQPSVDAQTQATLRTANRLLSQTLATAQHSMLAELAPSQTHILLRAPRRFAHPAWVPRQTASSALDTTLREFRQEAGDMEPPPSKPTKRNHKNLKPKVEGAWITCRTPGVEFPDSETEAGVVQEEDEMIWWSWDGKLVGFADW